MLLGELTPARVPEDREVVDVKAHPTTRPPESESSDVGRSRFADAPVFERLLILRLPKRLPESAVKGDVRAAHAEARIASGGRSARFTKAKNAASGRCHPAATPTAQLPFDLGEEG